MIQFETSFTHHQLTDAKGFSLIELMVTLAVIGIISAIAIPIYTDYLDTANEAVMVTNIGSIRLFEEDLKLSDGDYVEGTYDPGDPDAANGLKAKLGWSPRTTKDVITYVVSDKSASGFKVVATDNDLNHTVTRWYPCGTEAACP